MSNEKAAEDIFPLRRAGDHFYEPIDLIAQQKTLTVIATLSERDKRYGGFINNASIAQRLKMVMRSTSVWDDLTWDKREALEMIASKIGRMLSGDPEYVDNWHDIAGYATLVEQRLTKETK